jgi:competence protein ComGC
VRTQGLLTIPTVQKRERVMNREYLEAKVDLCLNQAEVDLQQEEIARAIANLRRANSALTQLFGFEEEENE